MKPSFKVIVAASIILVGFASPLRSQESLQQLEQAAIERAVDFVSPSVVQIDTVGGLEVSGDTTVSTGPFSGVSISESGLILTSAFNLRGQPAGIFVRLPNGERVATELFARDETRNLVILKITGEFSGLKPALFADKASVMPGQTAIAVGKTYDWQSPGISVGVISATGRIWNRAVQTDAKVSAINYGGPLINLRGEVIGVLTPLANDDSTPTAGAQWYDSGIGFAALVDRLLDQVELMERGTVLSPGVSGLEFAGSNIYADSAEVGVSRVDSPAYVAGVRSGDVVTSVNGRDVVRQAQYLHATGELYAGDRVSLSVLRNEESLQFEFDLASTLPPYRMPALGVLVSDSANSDSANAAGNDAGVAVAHVIANGPADKSGILAGDLITSFAGQSISSRNDLQSSLATKSVGEEIPLSINRDSENINLSIQLALQDASPVPEFALNTGSEAWLKVPVRVADAGNDCFAIIPPALDSAPSPALLVWLADPRGFELDDLAGVLIDKCRDEHVIVLIVHPVSDSRWDPGESDVVLRAIQILSQQSAFDSQKVVIGGTQSGGTMATRIVASNRQVFRGLAIGDSRLHSTFKGERTSPVSPLLIYLATSSDSPDDQRTVEDLRNKQFPVFTGEFESGDSIALLGQIIDWAKTVDRL